MTPYYADEAVTIYHGDAQLLCADLRAQRVITDPPYGFNAYYHDKEIGHVLSLLLAAAEKTVAVFGYAELLVEWCIGVGRAPDEWVTWWPTNAMRRFDPWDRLPREAEHIAIFGPTPGAGGLTRPRSANAERLSSRGESRLGDVWRAARPGVAFNAKQRQHPNEKPMDVMRRLVSMCSEPGDTILDPFMGSGTTLRAAKDLGRHAIGVDIDEVHCETAARRCSQEVLGLPA